MRELAVTETVTDNTPLPSEKAAEEADMVGSRVPESIQELLRQEGEQELEHQAKLKAAQSGVNKEAILKQLRSESTEQRYKIIVASQPEGPFFRPVMAGGQIQVILNSAHPFFTEIYAHPESSPWIKEGISALLLSMAATEMNAVGDDARRAFYRQERLKWSENLHTILDLLPEYMATLDDPSEESE